MVDLLTLQTSSTNPNFITVVYTVSISLFLSIMIAITYEKTFRGLAYSRNFIQAMVLGSIVAATVMQAIGDSLARGLGMIGALAIIRFRTNFKDPRDIIFMFASLASGIACGVGGYLTGIIGTLIFSAAAFLLYFSSFGQTRYFDGLLRFVISSNDTTKNSLDLIFKDYCKSFALVTLRDIAQGTKLDYAYHIKLKKGKTNTDFINAIKKIDTIENVNLMLQETTVEL